MNSYPFQMALISISIDTTRYTKTRRREKYRRANNPNRPELVYILFSLPSTHWHVSHIVGLTRICRFSPRIQQFSSRFRRELLNSPLEICNSRRDENCFSPLTTRIAQFSVTLERMRELLFSGEQRRQ